MESAFGEHHPTMDRSMLNKATTNDRNPTPGYLYNDISSASGIQCARRRRRGRFASRFDLRSAHQRPPPAHTPRSRAEITHASPDDCEKLVNWLVARLRKSQPNIKYKVLVIVRVRCSLSLGAARMACGCLPPELSLTATSTRLHPRATLSLLHATANRSQRQRDVPPRLFRADAADQGVPSVPWQARSGVRRGAV